MTTDDESTTRLIGFGLSEKEAQTYLHLLKYGPKTPSPLAKSLHSYREDVHRTLTSLIEKGMVRPSLNSPTVYTPVDLETALGAALKKQESELREMEARKRELQELSKQHHFRPSDEVTTFKILKSVKEVISAAIPLIDLMQEEWLVAVLGEATILASLFGINDAASEFIKRRGKVRVVVDISYQIIEPVRETISIGEELRHNDQFNEIFLIVGDKRQSASAINLRVQEYTLDTPISAFWCDSHAYSEYLLTSFENVWSEAVPAEEWIKEPWNGALRKHKVSHSISQQSQH